MYVYIYINPLKKIPKGSKIHPKSAKLGAKIHQIGVQNPSTWGPKTIKIGLGRGLGEDLGPSWPQEAPRPLQRAPRQN